MIRTPEFNLNKLLVGIGILAFASCKSGSSTENGFAVADSIANVDSVKPINGENPLPGTDSIFNISSVPVSEKDLGTFPYLKLPITYTYNYSKEISPSSIKDVDKEYFAVYGTLIPEEGKTFKATLEKNRADGKRFNSLELQRSIDKSVADLGGIKLKTVAIKQSEWDRIGNKELIDDKYGFSIDLNSLDNIQTYVIRTKTKVVWIQVFLLNEESGKITILEKAAQN
jgi:OOP family OmpA-OmpF porin